MPIGKVWIYRLLFVFLCVFVRLRISPPRIKLSASNLAWRFIGVQGRETHIFVNLGIGKRAGHAYPHVNITACGLACVDIQPSLKDGGTCSLVSCCQSVNSLVMIGSQFFSRHTSVASGT